MAPRKRKIQGKETSTKIKSKVNTAESVSQEMKNEEKPLESMKWLKPMTADENRCEAIPDWINGPFYSKHGIPSTSTMDNANDYGRFRPKEHEDKSSSSASGSEECECSRSEYQEKAFGILKKKCSSTNSLVAHYIKSGMDHVASFIVESAIRFGRQHGVVVPDKNTPNVYEIMPPDRSRKIRFKIPDSTSLSSKKDRRRSHRKSKNSSSRRSPSPSNQKRHKSNPSRESLSDSLEDIIPLLKKLEEEGGGIVNSDLDLDKLVDESDTEDHERVRDRSRKKYRTLEKRYKSVGDVLETHKNRKYSSPSKRHWKRFKRDSLELGRERLRGSTGTRKDESVSPSIY